MPAGNKNGWRWCIALAAVCILPVFGETRARESRPQQDSSVADAARRAREQKKKATKVITDEDLPRKDSSGPDPLNTGVQANPATEAANSGQSGQKEASQQNAEPVQASGKDSDKGGAEEDKEVAQVKEQIAQGEKDLDLLKREFALDREAYYSKTDYASDTAGKAKLDSEQQQISDKQQEVEALKARLAALQEQRVRRKGKSPASGEIEKPATPPQS